MDQAEALDGPAPGIDAEPDKYNIEVFEVEPGDAVDFHGKSLHSATPNSSKNIRRRALSLRFAGDDITWNPRHIYQPSPTSPTWLPAARSPALNIPASGQREILAHSPFNYTQQAP